MPRSDREKGGFLHWLVHQRGVWFIAIGVPLVIFWMAYDKPSKNFTPMTGTVEEAFWVFPRYHPAFIKCWIVANDGTRFEAHCHSLERNIVVPVQLHRRLLSRAPVYELAGD